MPLLRHARTSLESAAQHSSQAEASAESSDSLAVLPSSELPVEAKLLQLCLDLAVAAEVACVLLVLSDVLPSESEAEPEVDDVDVWNPSSSHSESGPSLLLLECWDLGLGIYWALKGTAI